MVTINLSLNVDPQQTELVPLNVEPSSKIDVLASEVAKKTKVSSENICEYWLN